MNKPWYIAINHCQDTGQPYALITILGVAGSTPREPGAKMVVTLDASYDTVGGGQLEFLIIQAAREKLLHGHTGIDMQAFPLAAEAQQCCGGHVSVLIESFAPATWNVAVFGAGHVAQQLIPILSRMPMRIFWFDNREEFVGDYTINHDSPHEAELNSFQSPESIIDELPAKTEVVILTHDHSLDYQLAKAALLRRDLPFVGCIGSTTKAQRFEHRLKKDGLAAVLPQRWVCPIGLPEVQGKLPIEVAVSISAQLVARKQLHSQHHHDRRGLAWRDLKSALATNEAMRANTISLSGEANTINPSLMNDNTDDE